MAAQDLPNTPDAADAALLVQFHLSLIASEIAGRNNGRGPLGQRIHPLRLSDVVLSGDADLNMYRGLGAESG